MGKAMLRILSYFDVLWSQPFFYPPFFVVAILHRYMAPEVALGKPYNGAADVYGEGAKHYLISLTSPAVLASCC